MRDVSLRHCVCLAPARISLDQTRGGKSHAEIHRRACTILPCTASCAILRRPRWLSPLRGRRSLRHGYVSGAARTARTQTPRGRAWRRCTHSTSDQLPASQRHHETSAVSHAPQHPSTRHSTALCYRQRDRNAQCSRPASLPAFASSLAPDARLCLFESAATRHSVLFSMQLVALISESRSRIVADPSAISARYLDPPCLRLYLL